MTYGAGGRRRCILAHIDMGEGVRSLAGPPISSSSNKKGEGVCTLDGTITSSSSNKKGEGVRTLASPSSNTGGEGMFANRASNSGSSL